MNCLVLARSALGGWYHSGISVTFPSTMLEIYCVCALDYFTISIKLLIIGIINRAAIPTTIFKCINKASNINVNMIEFVYKRFVSKIFSIIFTIVVAIMFVIVAFDADFYGIIIKITFNVDNYCWNGISYCVQFGNFLRKLIKFEKNCFL